MQTGQREKIIVAKKSSETKKPHLGNRNRNRNVQSMSMSMRERESV